MMTSCNYNTTTILLAQVPSGARHTTTTTTIAAQAPPGAHCNLDLALPVPESPVRPIIVIGTHHKAGVIIVPREVFRLNLLPARLSRKSGCYWEEDGEVMPPIEASPTGQLLDIPRHLCRIAPGHM